MKEKLNKILKTIVKFISIIIGLFLIQIVGFVLLIFLGEYVHYKINWSDKMTFGKYQAFSLCVEDAWCEEGLEINDDGENVIITKDYCLKKNYEWYEDRQICHLR